MTQTLKTKDRAERRCQVDWSQPVPAEFFHGSPEDFTVLRCFLADISTGGMAIRVEAPPRVDPKFGVVRICDSEGNAVIEMGGRIRWTRQTSLASKTYGFEFRQELPDDLLEQLIKQGIVTRRELPRKAANAPVTVKRSPMALKEGEPAVLSARLVDYSAGGAQLKTEVALAAGERIMVMTEAQKNAVLNVVWSSVDDGDFRCGCTFANPISSRAMEDAMRMAADMTPV